MAIVVEALHPSAVLHVPAGKRKVQLDHVATRSPVEVTAIGRDDVAPVGHREREALDLPGFRRDDRDPLYRVSGSGSLWCVLRSPGGAPVSDQEFLLALAGDPEDPRDEPLGLEAYGTPFRLGGHVTKRTFDWIAASRGVPVDLERSRSVERDDRDRAGQALARFVSEGYRIDRDRGWVLARMGVVFHGARGRAFKAALDLGQGPHLLEGPHALASGAADHPATVAYASEKGGMAREMPLAEAWLKATGGGDEGHGARIAANAMPGILRRIALDCADRRVAWKDRDGADRLREMAAALLPHAVDGMTGLHRYAGWPEVETVLRKVVAAAREMHGMRTRTLPTELGEANDIRALEVASGMGTVVARGYLPAIPVAPHAGEDMEALGGVAP